MKTKFALLSASLIISCGSVCHGSLIVWDGASTSPTSVSDPNVSVGPFSQNNNNGTTTMITTTSASSGYAGATGTGNFGAAAKIGALSTASSTYFAVVLTPASGYEITLTSISLGSRSTSTGPTTLSFFSSIDNYATAIESAPVPTTAAWVLSNKNLSGSSVTPIEFRIYGSGGAGAAGVNTANWRIDDINLAYTATAVSAAVPEPSTYLAGLLLALPFGVHGVRYLRNRKRA